MSLDLSYNGEWMNTTKTIIHQIFPARVIQQISKVEHERMYSDTLEYIIEAYDDEGQDISHEEIELELDRYFCSHYESIRCFHACRITNESSYRNKGIQRINDKLFLELALERFGQVASVENIKQACNKTEIDNHDMAVFFFTALENAKCSSQNHYLKCGSEMLQGLAWDLGLGNKGILSSQGRSCIIECKIPISQVKQIYRFDFWRQLITFSFQQSSGKVFQQEVPDWGFATDSDISPEFIVDFLYMKDSDYKYRLLLH